MLNTQAKLFTQLLDPLEHGRFEHLNTNAAGLGEAVRNETDKGGEKTSIGTNRSEILQQRMKNK